MKKHKIQPLEEDEEERLLREAAEESERHMDDDLSDWKPVNVRVTRDVTNVFYLRAEADELDEIADAAEAVGKDIDVFIREAALKEARRRKPSKSAVADVRKKARALAEAVEKL